MSYAVYLALVLGVLTFAAVCSRAGGWRRGVALVLLAVLVGSVNILIESFAFGVTDGPATLQALAFTAPVLAVMALIGAGASGLGGPRTGAPVPLRLTPLRIGAVALAYVAIYVAFGMLAYPHVADFYADKPLPGLAELIPLQILRGLIFVIAAAPLLRLNPRLAPLAVGLTFSILGGVAPLLMDNPLMPAHVRLVHGIEVGTSNLLFGALLAWVLSPRRRASAAPAPAA